MSNHSDQDHSSAASIMNAQSRFQKARFNSLASLGPKQGVSSNLTQSLQQQSISLSVSRNYLSKELKAKLRKTEEYLQKTPNQKPEDKQERAPFVSESTVRKLNKALSTDKLLARNLNSTHNYNKSLVELSEIPEVQIPPKIPKNPHHLYVNL